MRALKRRIADVVYRALVADTGRTLTSGPGRTIRGDSESSAAGLHPEHRHFGSVTPGPTTTLRPPTTGRFDAPRNQALDTKRLRSPPLEPSRELGGSSHRAKRGRVVVEPEAGNSTASLPRGRRRGQSQAAVRIRLAGAWGTSSRSSRDRRQPDAGHGSLPPQ